MPEWPGWSWPRRINSASSQRPATVCYKGTRAYLTVLTWTAILDNNIVLVRVYNVQGRTIFLQPSFSNLLNVNVSTKKIAFFHVLNSIFRLAKVFIGKPSFFNYNIYTYFPKFSYNFLLMLSKNNVLCSNLQRCSSQWPEVCVSKGNLNSRGNYPRFVIWMGQKSYCFFLFIYFFLFSFSLFFL